MRVRCVHALVLLVPMPLPRLYIERVCLSVSISFLFVFVECEYCIVRDPMFGGVSEVRVHDL